MLFTEVDDDVVVNLKVVMNEQVSDARDFGPRDVRTYAPKLDGHLLYGLTDNLKVSEHRVEAHLIVREVMDVTALYIADRPFGMHDSVL